MSLAPRLVLVLVLTAAAACFPRREVTPRTADELPSVLLVTLDTTRADVLESPDVSTPFFDSLAGRAVRFTQAYATAPMTLPSHASMLTGLYPAEHGLHENARYLDERHATLAQRLHQLGYTAAAFVSGVPLAGQFGLSRGFDRYDDELPDGAAERRADVTTDRAVAYLARASSRPLFLWVHYFDAHEPYDPPEPFRSRYAADPYLGEIAWVDTQLGRLLQAFADAMAGGRYAVIVAGDHGEGRGDHGEMLHGNLLYQGVMRVPLLAAGDSVAPAIVSDPVSLRQVFPTVLRWAGLDADGSLLDPPAGPALAEAMQPFLQYGWQPQVMAVAGTTKVIRAGKLEVYDVAQDPGEKDDLSGIRRLSPELRSAVRDYPLPTPPSAGVDERLDEETRQRLASLGYVSSTTEPIASRERTDAPRPADMSDLFAELDRASGLFVQGDYEAAIPVFEHILERDPGNLAAVLRLAVAHSSLGHDDEARENFARARRLSPDSIDVRHYLALHLVRTGRWADAAPLLESVLAATPNRLPTIEALAEVRERQGRLDEARTLLRSVVAAKPAPAAELVRLGELSMALGDTPGAIDAFEQARSLQGNAFRHSLELGVCYLAGRRLEDARAALDLVPPSHPGYPMALFKRAQVSVLLGEPDRAERIRRAYREADATTGPLIEREPLFRDVRLR